MKPTIVEIGIFYTGDFSENDTAETDEKIRAGYKKITFCPSRGCQWSETQSKILTQQFRNGFNGICCPACSRRLIVKQIPISEQDYENEINRNGRNGNAKC